MDAELARLAGEAPRTRRLYEQAAASARQARFPLNAALTCELAGRFELDQGDRHEADKWLRAAQDGYERWGAGAKVASLTEEFPGIS